MKSMNCVTYHVLLLDPGGNQDIQDKKRYTFTTAGENKPSMAQSQVFGG